jgi:hypothetical protein
MERYKARGLQLSRRAITAITTNAVLLAVCALYASSNYNARKVAVISEVFVELHSPTHAVRITWEGDAAGSMPTGPFPSSPGCGTGSNDCNDTVESLCPGSKCTPKGRYYVEGLATTFPQNRRYSHVTYIDKKRMIAIHGYPTIHTYPASAGCIRVHPRIAKLIHDNVVLGKTEVVIGGTWTHPREVQRRCVATNSL